jgi:hypothetical protein
MKKLVILSMALGLFVACNNNKPGMQREKTGSYKDDYNGKDDENKNTDRDKMDENDNKNNRTNNDDENTKPATHTSSTGAWGSSNEEIFVSNCVSSAVDGGFTKSKATAYCNCMLEKLEDKYPDPNDVGGLDENSPEMKRMATECVSELNN